MAESQNKDTFDGRRGRSSERAQSLVEFAFVLPIFLLIIMATVDFAVGLKTYITITNAAREGARLAVTLSPTDPDTVTLVQDHVADRSAGLVEAGDVTIAYPIDAASDNPVEVTAEYEYKYITPLGKLLSFFSAGSITDPLHMSSTSTMRVE
jgi:Flp pilus assembly protein TadG